MRTTIAMLEHLTEALNTKKGFEDPKWNTIGSYQLSGAYGGYSLHMVASEGGGVHDVFRSGHISKKELYTMMQAYILGMEDSK